MVNKSQIFHPPGASVSSLNGLSGSVVLTSSGGTISITNVGNNIDLETISAPASSINGLIAPGTGITLTGGGTALSPYAINSTWTQSGNNIYNNNTGNVGIGTTAPLGNLDVRLTSGGTAGLLINYSNQSYLRAGSASTGDVHLGDISTRNILLGEGGGVNVGIGITAPSASLHIDRPNDGNSILRLSVLNSVVGYDFSRSASTGALSLQGDQAGFNNILLAPSSGNVGIGTTAPDTKLQVVVASVTDGIEVVNNPGSSRYRTYMTVDTSAGYIDSYHYGSGPIPLSINPNGGNILFNGGGNVGVGTGTPAYPLDVNGTTRIGTLNGLIKGTTGVLSAATAGTDYLVPTGAFTAGSVLFSNSTQVAQDNANFFWDDTNNRLGVGTATPTQRLDVNGSAKATVVITPAINTATVSNFALGNGATATASDSTAVAIGPGNPNTGPGAAASGEGAVALGGTADIYAYAAAQATGVASTAIGAGAVASNDFATSIGGGTASGNGATNIGSNTISGDDATAVGINNFVKGFAATAIGYINSAYADYSLAIGQNAVVGTNANPSANGVGSVALSLTGSGSPAVLKADTSLLIAGQATAGGQLTAANTFYVNGLKFVFSNGSLGTISATACGFDISRVTDALLMPKGSTAQRPTGVTGMDRFNTDVGDFEVYNGAWQPRGRPGILSTTAGINAKTIANTLVYTVPSGKTCVVTAYVVRCTAASAITVGPSASVGTTAGGTDIATSQTMAVLTGTTNIFNWPIVGMSVSSTTSVYFNIGTASTGTSQTIAVDLIGYLV